MENKKNIGQKISLRKKFKPYYKFIIIGLLVLIGILILNSNINTHNIQEFASDINPDKQSCKEMVKDGHFEKHPQKSVKESFDNFFSNPKWKYFYSTDGKDIVEFSGKCQYEKQTVTAKIQFIVNKSAGTFKLGALSFNDVPENLLTEAALISKIYDNAEDTSEQTENTTQNTQSQITDKTSDTDTDTNKNININNHSSQPTKFTYKNYANSRFGFSIDYPDFLTNNSISTNGDGIILTSQTGDAKLTVSGINNSLNSTAKSEYNNAVSSNNNISYKIQSGNWFILSWVENNKIVYEKEIVGTGSINTFILEYPIDQKKFYEPIIKKINESFKTPALNESH